MMYGMDLKYGYKIKNRYIDMYSRTHPDWPRRWLHRVFSKSTSLVVEEFRRCDDPCCFIETWL